MRALCVTDDGVALRDVRELDASAAGGDELVRVTLSGICNTDLEIARGYAGFRGTIGHEFVGVALTGDLAGARVVGEINAGCGTCDKCGAGDSRHCATRTVLGIVGRDGAHADILRLPARNLLRVPDNVPDTQAVFAEPLAAACGILERCPIAPGERVAVIGDGKLGLLSAFVLADAGHRPLLIGKHRDKLALADARNIATSLETTHGRIFDVVVEASGSAAGFATALDLLRPQGRMVLKSTIAGATPIDAARIVVEEITVIGSRCGRFAPALALLERGLDLSPLVSEVMSLDDGEAAMRRAATPGVLKVLLSRP